MKSNTKISWLPWLIWGLGAAFFFLQYATRVSPSVMTKQLMQEFAAGAFAISTLSSCFYFTYISMQIPVGMLLDRFSTRLLLTMATVVTSLGCFIFAGSHHLYVANFGLLLAGFGASFGFVSALKLAADWFPANMFGMLSGATQACGMIGAVVGVIPVTFAVKYIGWRHTLLIIAFIFLLLSTSIFLIVRDKQDKQKVKTSKIIQKNSLLKNLIIVLKNPQSWLNAIVIGLMYSPITGFGALWGVRCLSRIYDISTAAAATALSVIYIGWMAGGPVTGWFSDHIGKRKPIMLTASLFCSILFGIVLYVPHLPIWSMFVLLFLLGVANSGATLSYAFSKEINHHSVSGTSVAFANMASVIVGTGFLLLIGWLLDFNWSGKMIHGIRYYSINNFRIAMLTLVACYIAAGLLMFFLKETNCKNIASEIIE